MTKNELKNVMRIFIQGQLVLLGQALEEDKDVDIQNIYGENIDTLIFAIASKEDYERWSDVASSYKFWEDFVEETHRILDKYLNDGRCSFSSKNIIYLKNHLKEN